MTTRTKPSQLPSYEELCAILLHEAPRKIAKEKEGIHYTDFTAIIRLMESCNLPTGFFSANISFADLKDPRVFAEIAAVFDDLVENILTTHDNPAQQILFNDLYDYLSESDSPERADIIFVFGSKSTLRIEKAIKLYKAGYAQKILVSGKSPFYEKDNTAVSEAEALAKHAMNSGVPSGVIILEKYSITVPDNVKRSLDLLEHESIPHERIIIVNSPFAQRRGWAHFKKMSRDETKIIRVNTDTVSEQFSRDGWYRDEAGARVITKEFFGLRISTLINTA